MSPGRVLHFTVTGALLAAVPIACEPSDDDEIREPGAPPKPIVTNPGPPAWPPVDPDEELTTPPPPPTINPGPTPRSPRS
jgi:hypothetical protein